MKNKLIKVRMDIIGLYGLPERFCFIKENHILATDRFLIGLYQKCLRMGYDISDAEIEIKYYQYVRDKKTMKISLIPIDKPSIKYYIDEYFREKRIDRGYRKFDYEHRKEKIDGSV